MDQESRVCQNCKSSFTIEPEDFRFYEKIKVPVPTWCYLCRFQRRGTYRNQMNLYSVKCGLCDKQTLTMYAPGNPFPVYCQECWWSDKWSALDYGKKYDFSKPFFIQYRELLEKTPRLALSNSNSVNSEYCNYTDNNKDCYLCFSSGESENCLYCGPNFISNKWVINSATTTNSEQSYSLIDCNKCYRLYFSQNSENCLNSAFLFDCRGCSDCLGCVNLRNQKYHVFNKPYTKEEYEKKLKEYNFGSYKRLVAFQKEFEVFLESQAHRFMQSINCVEVSGNNIVNSKNCHNCFSTNNSENCNNSYTINGARECYDINGIYPMAELSYEGYSVVNSSRVKFSLVAISGSLDIEYSDTCATVEQSFGCISLKKTKYCILNKQYAKEEYEELVTKIKQQMKDMPYIDSKGKVYKYGEFFPPEFSPFGYNDTLSQEFFPKTKEEAIAAGWKWQDPVEKELHITMKTEEVTDDIKNVEDSILQATIECAHKKQCNESCTGAFKIIKAELDFYRHHNLALPRICIKCRAFERVKKRNPLQLWKRQCMCNQTHSHHENQCSKEFETSYAPERPETIYCEQCFNAEVV